MKDLQQKVQKRQPPSQLSALLSHGIMRQRFYDLVTDSLRAQLLSIFGYQASVIEFVDAGHTPRNLMIRAIKKDETNIDRSGIMALLQEYDELKKFVGGVKPHLELLLSDKLSTIRESSAVESKGA